MTRLEETHGVKFELVRHFLARMFDSEMFSTRGQWWTVAVSAFALAVPAGLLLLDPPYYHREVAPLPETLRAVALADELALLTLIFAVTGILALLAWQSLFPSRRDYLALAGMPVRSRQIFGARFASVILLAAAITLAMSVLPAIMAPHQFTAARAVEVSALTSALARAAASSLGCLFVFFAIVAIQGLLINALPARLFARFSAYVQGALVAVFFLAALYSWFIVDWREPEIARLPDLGAWAPPVWFLGLHQALIGDRDAFFASMAARGLAAAGGSLALAALMYLAAYGRYRRLLLESTDASAGPQFFGWSVARLLARNPRKQAAIDFIVKVLSRSRVHRVVLLAYAGGGLAVMINSVLIASLTKRWAGGWREVLMFVVAYWPIGLSFIMLAGVRHAFAMPAELPANWLFRINESQGRREWMSAVERFVTGCVIAPIHLAALPVAAVVFGWPIAVRMTVMQALVSLSAFELLFYSWQQFPFTCSYVPGKRPLVSLFASWFAVLVIVVPIVSRMVGGLSLMLEVFLFFGTIFAGGWLWARRQRREGWGEARLIYEDINDAVADLGIKDLTYGGARMEAAESSGAAGVAHAVPPPAPSKRPWAVSLRVYRRMAEVFPHEFKNAYGEELAQVTEDAIENVWRRHGTPGLVRLLLDVALRVPAEHLSELRQDVRYGFRRLVGSPGFTAVALVSLGLGMAVASSMFSDLNGVVFRDVPGVAKPGELVTLEAPSSYPTYRRYRERTDLFSATLAYMAPVPFGVSLDGRTERIWGHLVTPSYFSALGVRPKLGRVFGEEPEYPGQPPAAVVSFRFWQTHLGGDWSVIGQTLRINGRPCTIIGVGPKDFLGASPMLYVADIWLPIWTDAGVAPELADNPLERRDLKVFQFVGRLKPRVAAGRAEAELDTVARQLEQAYGEEDKRQKGRRVTLLPGGKLIPLRKESLPMMTAFFGTLVGLVLVIACSNVGNMMLARAAERRREIALRLALGASRARLIRQLLTESMLVATGAGALGLLLTEWLMHLASQIQFPYPMPLKFEVEPDARVLVFTLILTAFTGLAFGLLPAFRATRTDLTPALKEGRILRFRRYRRLSARNLLVLSQVAGSLMLLLLTVYVVVEYQKRIGMVVNFDPRNLYLISLDPIRSGYSGEQAAAFMTNVLDRVQKLPAVSAASLTNTIPMSLTGGGSVTFSVTGPDDPKSRVVRSAHRALVGKDYFETTGVPILLGRGFRKEDESPKAMAVVVSEQLGREFWKGADPLGRRIEIGDQEAAPFKLGSSFDDQRGSLGKARRVFEVVGVARNEKDSVFKPKAKTEARPFIYFPLRAADLAQPSVQGVTLMVRAAPGANAVDAVRREISAMDANITPFNVRTMPDQIDLLEFPYHVAMWTYGALGAFGLILALVGLGGVTAYSVTQRGHEIGVRMALGARSTDVLRLVMKEGLVLVAIGTGIGLTGAAAGARALSVVLPAAAGVASGNNSDPVLIVGIPLMMAALALAACYLPARRSVRIDPVITLRQE